MAGIARNKRPAGRGRVWASMAIAGAGALIPATAFAHGEGSPKPAWSSIVTAWEFDPFVVFAVLVTSWAYLSAVRSVNRAHPKAPFPRRRTGWFFAGMAVFVIAVMSPIAAYDGDLFMVHMWQHMLLTLVAAPFMVLGTPITLALRAAPPRLRKDVLLPILHSRAVKAVTFPVVAWIVFAGSMWLSHFSPLYNAALDDEWLHRLEHFLFIVPAILFWWQAVGADPTAWRMNHPVKMLYVFLQMPQNSFLAAAFYNSGNVLYDHYAQLLREWGPSPLLDQQYAGMSMWIGGDLAFLLWLVYLAFGWVKHEERRTRQLDIALERERNAQNADKVQPIESESGSPA